jgi:hypothetical protein
MESHAFLANHNLPDLLGGHLKHDANENRDRNQQVTILTQQLQVYKQQQFALSKELASLQAKEDSKEASLHDIEQDNKMLINKVIAQEKEMSSLRERLQYQQEKATTLSKQLFSVKKEKGLDDKALKLREENQALKKQLIMVRAQLKSKGEEHKSDDFSEMSQDHTINGGLEEELLQEFQEDNNKSKKLGMEGLRWQLWASQDHDDDDDDKEDPKASKMKWTQARSAGDPDFVSFQNEIEQVCQEIQDKTSIIQQLRRHIRQKETKFTETFGKHIVRANESLAQVKEDAAVEIEVLQKQLAEKSKLKLENSEQLKTIEALKTERTNTVKLFQAEQVGKNHHIHALEQTIHSQDRIIDNMTKEMSELEMCMTVLSERRRCEVEDLQLEMIAIETKANESEQMVTRLNDLMERRRVDYLAQVESCQILIEELESDGPLAKMVQAMEKTEIITEIRMRVGNLKAMNQSLQEENLRLGFKLDGAAAKLKAFERQQKEYETMRKESISLTKQLKDLEFSFKHEIDEGNSRLRGKVNELEKKLRQKERDLLAEQVKEWQERATEASSTSSSFCRRAKKEKRRAILDELDPENPVETVQAEKAQMQITGEVML